MSADACFSFFFFVLAAYIPCINIRNAQSCCERSECATRWPYFLCNEYTVVCHNKGFSVFDFFKGSKTETCICACSVLLFSRPHLCCVFFFLFFFYFFWKSILQVPDTGTRVLDNTRPFLCSSIVSFWIIPAGSKERKYHVFRQYWYTKNVLVFTNTGTFQRGPEVYFFHIFCFCQRDWCITSVVDYVELHLFNIIVVE